MGHSHRAGVLKQRNKKFKKRTGAAAPVSAAAFKAAENRKAAAPAIAAAVRPINKQQRILKTKHKRERQLERIQQLKQSFRGAAACGHAAFPPRIVLVISFSRKIESSRVCAALCRQLAQDAPRPTAPRHSPPTLTSVSSPRGGQTAFPRGYSSSIPGCRCRAAAVGERKAGDFSLTKPLVHSLPAYACSPTLPQQRAQQRLLLLPAPPPDDLMQLLSLCTCADLLLCAFAGECTYTAPAFDDAGYRFLAALKMQGVPLVIGLGLSSATLSDVLSCPLSYPSQQLFCAPRRQKQQQQQERCGGDGGATDDSGERRQEAREKEAKDEKQEEQREEEMDGGEGEAGGKVSVDGLAAAAAGENGGAAVPRQRNRKQSSSNDAESLRFQQRYFSSEFGQEK